MAAFGIGEDLNHAEQSVIPGGNRDSIGPHAAHTLGHQRLAALSHALDLDVAKNVELGPKVLQQIVIDSLHFPALGTDTNTGADHLGQGDQIFEGVRPCRGSSTSIGEGLDAMQHADGESAAALRTPAGGGPCLLWCPADTALAMPVQVVLALFGVELDGAGETRRIAAAQRRADRRVGQVCVETGCLAPQSGCRVGVRIGHHCIAVQAGEAAVHLRVG